MPAEESHGRGQTRDGHGKFIRDLDTATKDMLAAGLRTSGTSYKVIAAKLGYANESGAHKAVQRALAAVPVEEVTELRAIESARLDELTEKLWGVLQTKYPHQVGGRMIVDGDDTPVGDPAVALAAVGKLLAISARRSRLLGLDTPPPREPEPPKPGALELTGPQIAVLQQLAQALALEPAAVPAALLALPMAVEKTRETA